MKTHVKPLRLVGVLPLFLFLFFLLSACQRPPAVQGPKQEALVSVDVRAPNGLFDLHMKAGQPIGDTLVLQTVIPDPVAGTLKWVAKIPGSVIRDVTVVPDPAKGHPFYTLRHRPTGDIAPLSVQMNERKGPGPNEKTYAGTYENTSTGERYTYSAVTDPAPAAVIVGIGAAACLGVILIEAIATNCGAECDEVCGSAGVKSCEVHVTFGMSWDPFKIGCGKDCIIECK